jgi:hypothetical protein
MTLSSTTRTLRRRAAGRSRNPIGRRLVSFASVSAIALALGASPAAAVTKVTPTLATNASPSTSVGLQVFDHTNLAGGASPTGTITFKLYGPGDTTCQTSLFTATVPVSGTGSDNSPAYTTTTAGTYNWIATYNGDANNNPVSAPCDTASQAVIVNKVFPVTSVTPTLVGSAIHGTAALQGGFGVLTGTVTFTLTGPNDQFCSGPTFYTETIPIDGAGSYDSGSFTPTIAGTYTYRVSYSGDTNNYGVPISSCLNQGDSIAIATSQLAPPATPAPPSDPGPPATPGPPAPGAPAKPAPPSTTAPPDNPTAPSSPTSGGEPPASGRSSTSQPKAGGIAGSTAKGTASGARIFGIPTGCVRRAFKVYVTGSGVSGVTYYLDTRRLSRVGRADSRKRFVATVSARGLHRRSAHTLTARITTRSAKRVLRGAFRICG